MKSFIACISIFIVYIHKCNALPVTVNPDLKRPREYNTLKVDWNGLKITVCTGNPGADIDKVKIRSKVLWDRSREGNSFVELVSLESRTGFGLRAAVVTLHLGYSQTGRFFLESGFDYNPVSEDEFWTRIIDYARSNVSAGPELPEHPFFNALLTRFNGSQPEQM